MPVKKPAKTRGRAASTSGAAFASGSLTRGVFVVSAMVHHDIAPARGIMSEEYQFVASVGHQINDLAVLPRRSQSHLQSRFQKSRPGAIILTTQ